MSAGAGMRSASERSVGNGMLTVVGKAGSGLFEVASRLAFVFEFGSRKQGEDRGGFLYLCNFRSAGILRELCIRGCSLMPSGERIAIFASALSCDGDFPSACCVSALVVRSRASWKPWLVEMRSVREISSVASSGFGGPKSLYFKYTNALMLARHRERSDLGNPCLGFGVRDR